MKSTFAIQTPQCDDGLGFYAAQFDPPLTYEPLGMQFNQFMPQGPGQNPPVSMADWTGEIMGDEVYRVRRAKNSIPMDVLLFLTSLYTIPIAKDSGTVAAASLTAAPTLGTSGPTLPSSTESG
ncbi:hypothetical protein B0A49_09610 [Cryomyces minteri]|uniref:Uncharacterized protein n=1 Tax=Cryomyces minteri TaxID=331657 RepID=A0A4V5NG91_9PEZI|nr:hypothetical protein B0A49_09610 [Cryomyces minteri]